MDDMEKLAREAARATWQFRAVAATTGNRTKLGAIVIAILGKAPNNPPAFNNAAKVTANGLILCDYWERDGSVHRGALVGSVQEVVGNFNGLADHLKLSDGQRLEMFGKLRAWITEDERAESGDLGK